MSGVDTSWSRMVLIDHGNETVALDETSKCAVDSHCCSCNIVCPSSGNSVGPDLKCDSALSD